MSDPTWNVFQPETPHAAIERLTRLNQVLLDETETLREAIERLEQELKDALQALNKL